MKAKFETLSKDQFAAWEQWKRGVEQAAANATSAVLHQMEARAKDVAAGQFKGVGRLAGSITVRKDSKLSGKVGPTVIYGRIQELGGTIYPRQAKMLHWVDATGSHFARHVTLPPRPYLKPGVEIVKPLIGSIVAAEMEKALGG